MQTTCNVGYRLAEEPLVGPGDSQPMRPLIREIIRYWREHKNYTSTVERRQFVETLACFHLRIIQALQQRGKGTSLDAVGTCVQHFTHRDCPAQETIQLQVTVEGVRFQETQRLLKRMERGRETLEQVRESIIQVKVVDMRRLYETVEVLHSKVMDYLVEYSRQMVQHRPESDPVVNEAEVLASLESVLPRKGLLYWMDLSDQAKMQQVEELTDIVMGIRVFNKCKGKGGAALQLPHEQFEIESEELAKRVEDALKLADDRIEGLTKGILLYIEEYGIQHIFIQRLRDDLAYCQQARIYLQNFSHLLLERFNTVLACSEKSTVCINTVYSLIENRKCIPVELVFPELRKLGVYHRNISDDYNLLQTHSKTVASLLSLVERPYYIQSPITARRLEIMAKNFLFLPRGVKRVDCPLDYIIEQGGPPSFLIKDEGAVEQLQERLQYGGFCAVNLVRFGGMLMHGDPKIGIIQIEDRAFSFADQASLDRFLNAPQSFIAGVNDIVLRLPYLIHILGLHSTPAYSFLSISSILQMIPKSFPNDFGVQTSIHPLPLHTWDEETLQKRVEELANKKTDSSQTCVEPSHFHRESVTQVWPPKDTWTQTGVPNSTSMPRYARVLHNLRGELHQDFKVVKSGYEWP